MNKVWKKTKIFIIESHIREQEDFLERCKSGDWVIRFVHWLRKASLDDTIEQIGQELGEAKKELAELKKEEKTNYIFYS